ncbi:MAG: YraN family protein [Dehalococcoidia bacterium]|nr:YraN family protein [Dehalococcoidia bacterium]
MQNDDRQTGPTIRSRRGLHAQNLARRRLESEGFRTLAENIRYRAGELDIVGVIDETLVAVEVRSRSTPNVGTPEESVTPAKAARLARLIEIYRQHHEAGNLPEHTRIDVVAVVFDRRGRVTRLTWHKNAIQDTN